MAVSAINSSLTIEAQSSLPKWCGNNEKRSTSLLQMWRELEVDHITSSSQPQVRGRSMQENAIELNTNLNNTRLSTGSGRGSVPSLNDSSEKENEHIISPRGRQNDHDDTRSSSTESTDYSEVERQRLREVFREWQDNGLMNNTPSDSHSNNSSKAQWLGEKECERVRIVREWVNKTTHQREICHGSREGQDSITGSQIDLVRKGLIVDQCETRPRRTIRRLCGRSFQTTGVPYLDVRIKWPNDLYIDGLKVGGILCTSTYKSKKFNVSAGLGLNVDNEKPTTSLNAVLRKFTSVSYQLQREDIISAFFNKFEIFFNLFMDQGFKPLEELYYKTWLHSGQRVIVEEKNDDKDEESQSVVTVQGLTSSGYLLAITDDNQMCELHPDGNSFDFFKGLIRRKLA